MMQNKATDRKQHESDFHGATIIDEHGNEIAITEDMVQKALDSLETPDAPQQESEH